MKIKIKILNDNCVPEVHGNLIDLKSSIYRVFHAPIISDKESLTIRHDKEAIPLGVVIKLPKYFRANLKGRSSLWFRKWLLVGNSIGVIDGDTNLTNVIKGIEVHSKANKGYNGESDEWKLAVVAFDITEVNIGERIAQFEILPTMDAPWYVHLKWIFNKKIVFDFVDSTLTSNREGIGSSGKGI